MVSTTHSGTFANELFIGPGTYQAKNGVRCFIDMKTTPGAVTVDAPISPEDDESFLIEWDNPGRQLLTIDSGFSSGLDVPITSEVQQSQSVSLRFRRGGVGFTFIGTHWETFNWSLYGTYMLVTFAFAFQGRATNGLCTIIGSEGIIEVERTAQGFYTVRLEPGTLSGAFTMPTTLPFAMGLPAETSPEVRIEDIGTILVDEIRLNVGTRNKNGQFMDDDLLQDSVNFIAMIGQQFP